MKIKVNYIEDYERLEMVQLDDKSRIVNLGSNYLPF